MAETELIAKMADVVAKEMVSVFGWQRSGPLNQNWECVENGHDKKTHPSDVVFGYDEPYTDQRIFVNTDLKSYAKGTITKEAVSGALRSLARSVECANRSKGWQDLYVGETAHWEAVGLLFIYNHDGEYDGDFERICDSIDEKSIEISYGRRVFLIGPKRVAYLASVAQDIRMRRGDGVLPGPADCGFYYPDLISKRPKKTTLGAASLEALCAPWQILRYQIAAQGAQLQERFIMYYDGTLEDIDECKYLIDFFFRYQLLRENSHIVIRGPFLRPEAEALFAHARRAYYEAFYSLPEFEQRLSRIQLEFMTSVSRQFSQVSLGMETHGA